MASAGLLVAGLAGLAAYLVGPTTYGHFTKVGMFRELKSMPLAYPEDLVTIKDTVHCEDIHYYMPAHTLFSACEDVSTTRFTWFPPLTYFDDPNVAWNSKGSIHTIDPEVSTLAMHASDRASGLVVVNNSPADQRIQASQVRKFRRTIHHARYRRDNRS